MMTAAFDAADSGDAAGSSVEHDSCDDEAGTR
jgi:hypothetical protein